MIKRNVWAPNKDWGIITKRMIEKYWSQDPEWLPSEAKICYVKKFESRGVLPSGVLESLEGKIKAKLFDSPSLDMVICAGNMAKHGYLNDVKGMWLGDHDEGMWLEGVDIASLASNLERYIGIENVSGCSLVKILDSVKCPLVVMFHQSLDSEETRALVRAMESRVEKVRLGCNVQLDIAALKKYSGEGKCKKLKCYDDTAARFKDQLGTWAARTTSRNWEMIGDDAYLTLRRDP